MSNTTLTKITESAILPMLAPKQNDLIQLIGKDNMIRETSFAIQAANSNSMLSTATPQSVAKAIWNTAISGLSLNPVTKLAYLIPKRINGIVEAVLMPSYQGLSKLITDTGAAINVYAHCVYKGDEFEVEFGSELRIGHKPKFQTNKKEDITHVYAVAVLHNESKAFEVMSIEDIFVIRERSDGWRSFKQGKASSCIWESDFSEMARKTAIKRLVKYLPKTDVKKWEHVLNAIEIDNAEYPASDGQCNYIDTLISTSTYDERQREYISSRVSGGLTQHEAETIISDLKENQLNPITHGSNYSQTEIKNHINDITAD